MVVMSDMGSNFYSLSLRLKVTPESPCFMHNDKYFLMFDPQHLLKCVQNNLMKYSFKLGQHIAKWKDIENFYNKDTALPIRAAPKLAEKYIRPNNFNKMKVKYATKILSHTVAASLCMYISVGAFHQLPWEQQSLFPNLILCLTVSTAPQFTQQKSLRWYTTTGYLFLNKSYFIIFFA